MIILYQYLSGKIRKDMPQKHYLGRIRRLATWNWRLGTCNWELATGIWQRATGKVRM